MSPEKPTVVIVPGSFSPASLYDILVAGLSSHGYPAQAVSIPSVGHRPNAAPATMADDATYIHAVTAKLVDEGKEIILVMQSYGGLPDTESARGLVKVHRETKGLKGGIIHLVHCTSFAVKEGQSLRDLNPTPELVPMESGYMIISEPLKMTYARLVFCDLPIEKGLECMEKMKEHSSASFDGKFTYPAYKYVPVTYLICENDKIIVPELQGEMIEMLMKDSVMEISVVSCTATHGVNISSPETIVDVIRKAEGEL